MNAANQQFDQVQRFCLLCGHDQLEMAAHLTGGQLRALWAQFDTRLSEAAWGNLAQETVVILHRCRRCDFEFFDPALAGGETFYRELEHAQYYPATKAEFTHALQFAHQRKVRRILDVGCGGGAFLDLARQEGFEVCGLEFNQPAAERAQARGHTVYMESLANLAGKSGLGQFDLITLFQVVEHLPHPVSVMQEAIRFLTPQGHIAVAVPNEGGVFRLDPWDPYNWPPHHITRWRREDLEQLAKQCSLRLVEIAGDPLEGPTIKHYWQTHNKLSPTLGIRPYPGGRVLPYAISKVYRLLFLKGVFPNWGHSIYAYYQRVS